MTPQELKNSILQLAIEGKLVKQRPEEGTAEELYREIQAEKQRLIKEGKIKKEKPLPEISEDEKPFEIPESWMWVRLGDIFSIIMGQSPDGNSVSENEKGIEFHQGKIYFSRLFLGCSPQKTTDPKKIAPAYSLLLCVRAPVGKVNITDREVCIGRGLAAIVNHAHISSLFAYYWISVLESVFIRKSTGTTFKSISFDIISNQVIPLPPLAEQKRIVAKIEELLPYVDCYAEAWNRLEELNKRFPSDMKKSLLQMAVEGKLVEQRPEEGTAEKLYREIQKEKQRLIKEGKIKKEKPLPEITEDEKPFDIPESWMWVRLSDVVDVRDGTHDTPKYVSKGVPLVTSKNLVDGRIDFETAKLISKEDSESINIRSGVDNGDILFAMIGTIGNPVLVKKDRDFSIKNMALFKQIDGKLFYMEFLLCFLQMAQDDMKKIASASVQSFVSLSLLRNYPFPLPPLAEQKRIVAKLDELLAVCDRLK